MHLRLSVFALLVMAAAGCSALVDTGGLTGGDSVSPGGTDKEADASSGSDVSADASPTSDGGSLVDGGDENDAGDGGTEGGYPDPVVMVAGAGIAAPSGNAQEQHLVYVKPNESYWFFTLSGTDKIAAYMSKDMKSWSSPMTATLPVAHGNDGRNMSVTAMPGAAVVHAAIACLTGSAGTYVHARATLPSDVIAFDPFRTIGSSLPNPSTFVAGPATTIIPASSNMVVDALDLVANGGTFNGAVWRYGSELGTSFSDAAPVQDEMYYPDGWVNAQTLIPLASGGLFYAAELADKEPDPSNVEYGVHGTAGNWSGGKIFPVDATQNYNDWSLYRVTDTEIHAVRYSTAKGFEHRKFMGSAWQDGGTIPAMTPLVGGGVVLVGDGATFSLFAIDGGGARTIKRIVWDGASWGPSWRDVTKTTAVRTFLGGLSSPGHKAVYWTEENSGALDVIGVPVP